MTKDQKNEVIELLKEKFSQYNNFYITDTESLSVAQISNLRRTCFNQQVEVKVAKNTLIRKALENLDSEKYAGLYESLNNVIASHLTHFLLIFMAAYLGPPNFILSFWYLVNLYSSFEPVNLTTSLKFSDTCGAPIPLCTIQFLRM